jgi:DNA-binding CsgD family transcriptional regulator
MSPGCLAFDRLAREILAGQVRLRPPEAHIVDALRAGLSTREIADRLSVSTNVVLRVRREMLG